MAIKPRSRAHEDRLCKLEVDLANLRNDLAGMVANVQFDLALEAYKKHHAPRSIWQRLNAFLGR